MHVDVLSFVNPDGRCADERCGFITCCDGLCPAKQCNYYFLICQKTAGSPVSYERNETSGNCSALMSNQLTARPNDLHTFTNSIFGEKVIFSGEEWVGCSNFKEVEIILYYSPQMELRYI